MTRFHMILLGQDRLLSGWFSFKIARCTRLIGVGSVEILNLLSGKLKIRP
jgi:hypothetical protein